MGPATESGISDIISSTLFLTLSSDIRFAQSETSPTSLLLLSTWLSVVCKIASIPTIVSEPL